jgi:hypothetical protein
MKPIAKKTTVKKVAPKKTSPKTKLPDGRPVIVTTEWKGVFFGYSLDTSGATIKLTRARNCVYWSSDIRGFMGLASTGPNNTCRVGPPAEITLRGITSVLEVTPEAVSRWELGLWK